MSDTPTVYILHGDDEFGIAAFVKSMLDKMGDPTTADMNTTRMEGRIDFGKLQNAASAMPFLASRRLVLLTGAISALKSKSDQEKLTSLLGGLLPSTAFVIIEKASLKATHWLMKWAKSQGERVFIKPFTLPQGGALVNWIIKYAKEQGGTFDRQAASHLASLLSDDTRQVAQEVDKLLAYVNYARPVDIADVELLTAAVQQGDVFAMVDAIGSRNGRQALTMLHRLLAERDALSLYGMIIRQFRLLLLYKEMQQSSATPQEIAKAIKAHEFVVKKLGGQARNFDLAALERIYTRLVETDERIKTGKVSADVALDTLIVGLTH